MSLTLSTMLPLHQQAPSFSLLNVVKNTYSKLEELKGEKGTIIVFMCNHCPFVIHLLNHFTQLTKELKLEGIATVAISSNDIADYPQDSPKYMIELAHKYNFSFPYLYDPTQEVAKVYDAACTPDFYLFDKQNKLVYRGRYDESRPQSNVEITGQDLKNAAMNLANNLPISENQLPSMGCNIKWKQS